MYRIQTIFLAAIFFISCNNKSAEKKITTTETDSAVTVATLPDVEDVDMDSIINSEPVITSTSPSAMLRFNLPKGKTYAFTMEMDMNQEQGGQTVGSSMLYNYQMAVTGSSNNNKTLKVTYGKMEMNMNMGGQKLSFSSEDKSLDKNNPMQMVSRMFAAMKGKSFSMKVSPDGEILSVEGFDKLGEEMVNDMGVPEQQKDMFLQGFQSRFNSDMIRETFSQGFNFLPNKEVKPGDKWTKKMNIPIGETDAEINTTYTVKSISKNKVTIDALSNYPNNTGGLGDNLSRMIVNAETGMIIESIGETRQQGSNKVIARNKITAREL